MKTFALIFSALLLLSACPKPQEQAADAQHSATTSDASAMAGMDHSKMDHSQMAGMDHSKHQALEADKPTDQSIYQLDGKWQTQSDQTVKLADLGGQPQVLAMVYASCKNACPRIIADMKRIQADAEQKHPGKTRFVLVSIDPEVDTPARLAALAKKSHLDGEWQLLHGSSDQVMELAALLGVKYRKISDKDYAHTNLITVLNAKGEIVYRQQGLGVDPAQTLAALYQLYPAG